MANQHKHKLRGVRGISDELWEDAKKGAQSTGTDISSVTRQFYEAWLGYPGAKMPKSPTPGEEEGEV